MKRILTPYGLLGASLVMVGMALTGCATPPPPAPASYVVLLDNGDGTIGKIQVTGRNGVSTLEKVRESTLMVGAGGPSFIATEAQIKQDFGAALAIKPMKPRIYVLYFQSGGAKLTPESELELANVIADVERREAPDLSVVGHTDTEGDSDQNEKLGLVRAQWVSGLLKSPKLTASNVFVESHGEKNLLIATPDNTPEPRNRRVEVTVR